MCSGEDFFVLGLSPSFVCDLRIFQLLCMEPVRRLSICNSFTPSCHALGTKAWAERKKRLLPAVNNTAEGFAFKSKELLLIILP